MNEGSAQPECDGPATGHSEDILPDPGRPAFHTTRWTIVVAAGFSPDRQADTAMEKLCLTYWYPLYAHVRRRGYSTQDAEDLTQAFFTRLLEKNFLGGLNPERGRFRTFLLAALKHFLANEWDKSQRKKRGGGFPLLSLDSHDAESRYHIEPIDHLGPDKLYDRAWALTLLKRVLTQLEAANADNAHFQELKPCLTTERSAMNHREVAQKLGITEGAVRVAAHRLRRQYRELLRAEIADTLADPEQLEDELNALYAAFSA